MTSTKIQFPCTNCHKEVVSDAIECTLCLNWCHRKCAKLSKNMFKNLSNSSNYWYCSNCYNIFPYSNILDDEFLYLNSCTDFNCSQFELYKKCEELELDIESQAKYRDAFKLTFDSEEIFIRDLKIIVITTLTRSLLNE